MIAVISKVDNIGEAKSCDTEELFCIWKKVHRITAKWNILACLFKLILYLSRGNSAPENGFSINKLLLEIHGYLQKKETIKAIRILKDSILKYESILDISLAK